MGSAILKALQLLYSDTRFCINTRTKSTYHKKITEITDQFSDVRPAIARKDGAEAFVELAIPMITYFTKNVQGAHMVWKARSLRQFDQSQDTRTG